MEMEPVFSDSGLKIPQDDRNNARADKNKIRFFITNSSKKVLNRLIIHPPPQMCKTNIANIIKIYKKKLSLRTAPFYYPEMLIF